MSRKNSGEQTHKNPQTFPAHSSTALKEAPVVVVLGHVDHGKTSLLDAIRKTNVQSKEAGGITQSIGAYQVYYKEQPITFIDTPGHEAFSAMRARGGSVADIVLLIIASNEGVKPQTIESIGHIKAVGVPMIVTLTKSDLSTAAPEKVLQELLQHDVVTEQHGGNTVAVSVSAKTGEGIEALLEMILLVTEVNKKEVQSDLHSSGVIIESQRNARTGITATAIVKAGIVKQGDFIATKTAWGKIKRMTDWTGSVVQSVVVGTPTEVLGFTEVPQAGEMFYIVDSEKEARELQQTTEQVEQGEKITAEKVVPLLIKAETQGSLEAFKASLEALSDEDAKVSIVAAGLSTINEADVVLAGVSNAIILGFNVHADPAASRAAQLEHVPIMTYDIIYRALEDVGELLDSEVEKIRAVGEAHVMQVFQLSNGTYVAGSKILEGYLAKGQKVQVIRGDDIVHEARITSIRHEKEEKSKLEAESECGVTLSKNFQYEEGDILLAFAQ